MNSGLVKEVNFMKLIIAGARNFHDEVFLRKGVADFILEELTEGEELEIFVGGATGADALGADFAKDQGLPYRVFPARWDDLNAKPCLIKSRPDGTLYNSLAGPNRNREMAELATHCICFWNGKSPGTANMIQTAKKHLVVTKVIRY